MCVSPAHAQAVNFSYDSYPKQNPPPTGINSGTQDTVSQHTGSWTMTTLGARGQRRINEGYGFAVGEGGNDVGIGLIASGVNIRFTARYDGIDGAGDYDSTTPGTQPIDLSAVGSTFRMVMGWTANPVGYFSKNATAANNEIMQMGLIVPDSLAHLGLSKSLYIALNEQVAFGTGTATQSSPTQNSSTSLLQVRDSTGAIGALGNNVYYAAGQWNGTGPSYNYYYHVFDTTYRNVGYSGDGTANFEISVGLQTYGVLTGTSQTLLDSLTFGTVLVDTDLTSAILSDLRAAVGFNVIDNAAVSVTGSTYDYFETTLVPEPGVAMLLWLAVGAHLLRRRR